MIASEDINVLRKLTDALTSNGFLIDQTKEWEYAFDAMPDCIFVINLEYKMRFVNKVMCERLNKKRSSLLDRECYNVLKCADRKCELNYGEEEIAECLDKSLEMGEFYIDELKGWFKFTKSTIVDHRKKVLGFICVLSDITERKRAETDFHASELRYRRLFESAKDGILILDAMSGRIVDVNPFLVNLLGYSYEELCGKKVWELGFFKDIIANQSNFEELKAKGYIRYENLALETTNGYKIDVEFVSNVYMVNDHKVIQCNIRDITERKKAQEEIAKREAMLQSIFRTMPAGTGVISSPARKIILVNDTLCHMLGYTKSELEGQSAQILYRDEAEYMRVGIEKYAQVEKYGLGEVETQFKKKDGTFIDIRLRTTPIGNDDLFGGAAFNFTAADITKFKIAKRESVLSEAKYKQLVEITPTGIYEIDFRLMRITYANESIIEYTGYTKEEILTMSPMQLLGPKSQLKFKERLQKVAQGEIISPFAEFRIVRKDGSKFWVKTTATYKFDTLGLAGATVIAVDITKEKLQIAALEAARDETREANELLLAIYEFMPAIAILTTTNDYIIKDVNQKFTEVTGWAKEEAIGKTTADLNLWTDEKYRFEMRKLLESNNFTVDNIISEFKDRSGKLLKGLTSIRKLNCGETPCILAVTRDITNIIDEICK
jgi:PAS domain S-box-containing protein